MAISPRGLQSRVFIALSAAWLVCAPTTPSAAAVTAVVAGGSLVLTGDAADDAIFVTAIDGDSLQVAPCLGVDDESTPEVEGCQPTAALSTVNGGLVPVTFDGVTTNVVLQLGVGANQTTITGVTIPGLLVAKGGSGSDTIIVHTSSFGAGAKLDLGAGANSLVAIATTFGGKFTYKGGADADVVGFTAGGTPDPDVDPTPTLLGPTTISAGAGDNGLVIEGASIQGKLVYKGGADADTLGLAFLTMPSGGITAKLGAGSNSLTCPGGVVIEGGLAYSGGADADTITLGLVGLADTVKFAKDVKIAAGAGSNLVTLGGVNVGGVTNYKGGAGTDLFSWFKGTATGNVTAKMGAGEAKIVGEDLTGDLNVLALSELTIGGKLAYKGGKGTHGAVLLGVTVAGPTLCDFGAGTNAAYVTGGAFEAFSVKGKGGTDAVTFTNAQVHGNVVLALGAGTNLVGLDGSTLAADLTVKTGAGDDIVAIVNGATVQGVQTLDLGGGTNTVAP